VWGAVPVLNVDTYEHSYFIDYGSDRKAYLEAFMRNINWDEVNRRFVAAAQMSMSRK
jgi:Fe-Mn family superoxide dismutase